MNRVLRFSVNWSFLVFGVVFFLGIAHKILADAPASEPTSERDEVLIGNIFIPKSGYDSNDTVQITVDGYFQNSCFQIADTILDKDSNVFTVHQYATHPSAGPCGNPRIESFSKDITLGTLAPGDYRILFNLDPSPGLPSREVDFSISPAHTEKVDDLPYAAVNEVSVPDVVNGIRNIKAMVFGKFSSTCQEIKELRVVPEDYTIVVLPVLGNKPGVACVLESIPFAVPVMLGELPEGRYMVQVRSENGGAVDHVFSVIVPDPS